MYIEGVFYYSEDYGYRCYFMDYEREHFKEEMVGADLRIVVDRYRETLKEFIAKPEDDIEGVGLLSMRRYLKFKVECNPVNFLPF